MYSIIDIESNGAGYRKECIIDIAIYRYDGQKIIDQFISLVNPESDITPFVQKLTNITPKMVKTAPKFHEIARRIVELRPILLWWDTISILITECFASHFKD